MVAVVNKRPLKVLSAGTSGPVIVLPLSQVDRVKAVLDANHVWYRVNETAVTLDGQNHTTVVDFGRDGDATKVQAILDTVG